MGSSRGWDVKVILSGVAFGPEHEDEDGELVQPSEDEMTQVFRKLSVMEGDGEDANVITIRLPEGWTFTDTFTWVHEYKGTDEEEWTRGAAD